MPPTQKPIGRNHSDHVAPAATQASSDNRPLKQSQAAAFCSVALRTFKRMVADGTLPKGVLLHKRVVRWFPDELMAAMRAMPRAELAEPAALVSARQVRRSRIEAMKASMAASPDGTDQAVQRAIVKAKAPGWMASK